MKIEKAIEILKDILECCKGNQTEEWAERERAYELAISALEKQTPKKPLRQQLNVNDVLIGLCPVCKKMWCIKYKEYCANCGQALKWEVDYND